MKVQKLRAEGGEVVTLKILSDEERMPPKGSTVVLKQKWCTCETPVFHSYPGDGECTCGEFKHHVHCAMCGGISQTG